MTEPVAQITQFDTVYAKYIKDILTQGVTIPDRTGVGTIEIFGTMIDYGRISTSSFPLLSVKSVPFKPVVSELLWFIEGSTNERRLAEILYGKPRAELSDKKTIWTANATADYWNHPDGDLGNIYGKMWRSWPVYETYERRVHGVSITTGYIPKPLDQLQKVIEDIKRDPHSRRHLVMAWNPGEQTADKVALPPCHYAFQFNVINGHLNLLVQMRSNDCMLGQPFNVASYALLQIMVAQVTGLQPGELKFCIGSAHIYRNHLEGAHETLNRVANSVYTGAAPKLLIDDSIKHIDDFKMESFAIENYFPGPKITLPMAA